MVKMPSSKISSLDKNDNYSHLVISGLEDKSRECSVVNVHGIQLHEDLEEEDNKLLGWGELKTLDDHSLEDLVFKVLPTIQLTVDGDDNFKDVDTTNFIM